MAQNHDPPSVQWFMSLRATILVVAMVLLVGFRATFEPDNRPHRDNVVIHVYSVLCCSSGTLSDGSPRLQYSSVTASLLYEYRLLLYVWCAAGGSYR